MRRGRETVRGKITRKAQSFVSVRMEQKEINDAVCYLHDSTSPLQLGIYALLFGVLLSIGFVASSIAVRHAARAHQGAERCEERRAQHRAQIHAAGAQGTCTPDQQHVSRGIHATDVFPLGVGGTLVIRGERGKGRGEKERGGDRGWKKGREKKRRSGGDERGQRGAGYTGRASETLRSEGHEGRGGGGRKGRRQSGCVSTSTSSSSSSTIVSIIIIIIIIIISSSTTAAARAGLRQPSAAEQARGV
eukprot:6176789-Pleurochrysis_carterae.AAC.2